MWRSALPDPGGVERGGRRAASERRARSKDPPAPVWSILRGRSYEAAERRPPERREA
jgi:hypothetical protein